MNGLRFAYAVLTIGALLLSFYVLTLPPLPPIPEAESRPASLPFAPYLTPTPMSFEAMPTMTSRDRSLCFATNRIGADCS